MVKTCINYILGPLHVGVEILIIGTPNTGFCCYMENAADTLECSIYRFPISDIALKLLNSQFFQFRIMGARYASDEISPLYQLFDNRISQKSPSTGYQNLS